MGGGGPKERGSERSGETEREGWKVHRLGSLGARTEGSDTGVACTHYHRPLKEGSRVGTHLEAGPGGSGATESSVSSQSRLLSRGPTWDLQTGTVTLSFRGRVR